MGNNTVKNIILGILAVALVGMTVAYAALTQKLTIDSQASVAGSTWDVHFANLGAAEKTGNPVITTPAKLTNTTISDLDVAFTLPGESVSYTFDIVNGGSIDAKLDKITINSKENGITCTDESGSSESADAQAVCNNIIFNVTKATGEEFSAEDVLENQQTINAKLTVTFNSEATSVPSQKVTVDGLDAVFEYIQK